MSTQKENYPFIFIGHGELDANQLDKNEECFLWFKNEVKPEQRRDIMKTCPYPLAGIFYWADYFVQLGSGGDTYDIDIMSKYASQEFSDILDGAAGKKPEFWESKEFFELYNQSVQLFAKDLERWVLEVNQIVPVAFFIGPNRAKKGDPWNIWSYENLADIAFEYLLDFLHLYNELLNKDYPEIEDEAHIIEIKGIDSLIGIMRPVKIKHIFGFITKQILKDYLYENEIKSITEAENENLKKLIDSVYKADEIYEPFTTLSYSDSTLKHNASLIEHVIKNNDKNAAALFISKLESYTQLAFYSANNKTASIILEKPDPIAFLKELLNNQPPARKPVAASLLTFLANNLIKFGPAYGKKCDFIHASIAAEIFELGFDYPEVKEETFINAAACYDNLKEFDKLLEVSLKGYEKFPENTTIHVNILYSAQKLGKTDIAKQYAKKSEELSYQDPLLFLNHTYNLLTNGEFDKAKKMINSYVGKGGKLTPQIMGNIMYCYTVSGEDDGKRDTFLEALLNFIKGKGNLDFKTNPELICNATIVLNNLKRFTDSEILLEAFKNNKGKMTAGMYNQSMYSPVMLKDKVKIESTLNDFLKSYAKSPEIFNDHAYAFATASNCYALLSEADKTIEMLNLAKKYGWEIDYVKEEPDFKFLENNKKFIKLFK